MVKIETVKIKENIFWVGAKDPHLKVFDIVMETEWGTTYNSYLIIGQNKTALIDMVKDKFGNAYLEGVKKIIDPSKIDYIIINHCEPDHSGSLGDFLKQANNAQVVASRAGSMYLKEIVNSDIPIKIVGDGDEIDLGGKTLEFISAPFLHWPDSIFTYLKEERILFSGDVFGSHFCHDKIFDDEIGQEFTKSRRYYFDVIMSPFSKYVIEADHKIKNLDIHIICPSHGPVLRTNPRFYIDQFKQWAIEEISSLDDNDVFVGYVSAYNNTKMAAEEICKVLGKNGVRFRLYDISEQDHDYLRKTMLDSKIILIGTPTINKDSVKPAWELLSTLCAIRSRNKLYGVFGSYGWSGEAPSLIGERLKGLGLKPIDEPLKFKFVPSENEFEKIRQFAQRVSSHIKGTSQN